MKIIFLLSILFFCSSLWGIELSDSDFNYWKKLLHYRQDFKGAWKSAVVSSSFFVSKEGKTNPVKELNSFIEQLSSNNPQEIICRFPLRYKWVKKTFNLKLLDRLENCEIYSAYISKLDAKNISLVFSSFYLNNPGSIFGHTFLRVSRYKDFNSNELLDYAINFSVTESQDSLPLYMMKGLTGFYPGRFHVLPYYYKIREYSDHEFRDIWNYDLGLSPDQIQNVLDHAWELAQIDFDYYYLTQNCSYQIMSLLNVAFERVDLVSHLNSFFVLPLDTVKIMNKLKLLDKSRLRPSAYNKLVENTLNLDKKDLIKIKNLAGEGLNENDPILLDQSLKAAKILDGSILAVDYLEAPKVLLNDKKTIEKRHQILIQRAKNPNIDENIDLKKLDSKNPVESHHASRVGLSLGDRNLHGQFKEFSWRAATHELLDPPHGQLPYSQVVLLDLRARLQSHDFKSQYIILDKALLLDFKNYQPSNFWKDSLSYDFSVGFEQHQNCKTHDCLHPLTTFGVGNSVEPWSGKIISILIGGSYTFDPNENNQSLLSIGPKINFLTRFQTSALGLQGAYYWPYEVGGEWVERNLMFGAEWRYYLTHQMNIFFKASDLDMGSQSAREAQLGIYLFH